MTRTHSLWGGSSMPRRLACPASARLEAAAPPEPPSEAAMSGSAIHDAIEVALGRWRPGWSVDEVLDPVHGPLDDHQLYIVRYCVDVAVGRLNEHVFEGRDPSVTLEPKVEITGNPDFYGWADMAIVTKDSLDLIDWKSGRVDVELRDSDGKLNPSIAFYILGWLDTNGALGIERIYGWVVQPMSGGVAKDEVTVEELEAFRQELLSAYAFADHTPPVAGDWCRWCKAKPTCPAHHAYVLDPIDGLDMAEHPSVLGEDEVTGILDRADEIRRFLEDVESWAIYQIESGKAVGDYSVVPKRAIRRWTDEGAVYEELRQTNLAEDDFAPRKLLSPAQMTKITKALEAVDLSDHVEAVSSGVKLERNK